MNTEIVVIGLDIGTTGIKGLIVDDKGKIIKKEEEKLELISPHPGWAEQNPTDWWNGTINVLRRLVNYAKSQNFVVKAIATSGQMHSLVILDKSGNVLHNAILWCDQRTDTECFEIMNELGGQRKTIEILGNPVLPGFTAGKIRWLKKNVPDVFEKMSKVMLPKDYINYMLTGQIKTEHSDASGTAMYDIGKKEWSQEVLDVLEIKVDILPQIVESNGLVGKLREELKNEFGLSEDVLVFAGGADNACAALGIGVTKPDVGMISLGTSGTVLVPTEGNTPDLEGKVHLFSHVVKNTNYYMGVMLSATHTLNWFNELLGNEKYDIINDEISNVPIGARGIIVLPYLNGERTPHNDPYARGVVFGLSTSHSKWDLYRAVYESVAFGLKDCYDALLEKNVSQLRITGGGSNSDIWVKIISDVFGEKITLVNSKEGAAYGAAMLAYSGLTEKPVEQIADNWVSVTKTVVPEKGNTEIYTEVIEKYRKIYRTLKELFS